MFNAKRNIGAKLKASLEGWLRGDCTIDGAHVGEILLRICGVARAELTGVALIEGTKVSVGRGNGHPVEWIGAPVDQARETSEYRMPGRFPELGS